MTGTGRAPLRRGLDPAEVYETLGPITPAELRHLTRMSPGERNRWFANIYGITGARHARTQYTNLTRRTQP